MFPGISLDRTNGIRKEEEEEEENFITLIRSICCRPPFDSVQLHPGECLCFLVLLPFISKGLRYLDNICYVGEEFAHYSRPFLRSWMNASDFNFLFLLMWLGLEISSI